jgi:hypothetical protein
MEKVLLRVVGLLGIILFVPLLLFTFADSNLIEKSGKSFVEWKLQAEMYTRIESIHLPDETKLERLLGAKAQELRAKTDLQLNKIKQQLKDDAPAILSAQITKLQNLDCECRRKWEHSIRLSMDSKLASIEVLKTKFIDFSHVKYMEIVNKLTLDLRIFLAANSIVFIFLFVASFLQPRAIKQLFLPGGLMLISTVTCSYFYIFEQNWLYTIIYNDYTGLAYIGYLGVVFTILCDIVFNRARVTTEVLNACLQAVGQVGNLSPC